MKTLHIVADAHIWAVDAAFSTLPGFDVQLQVLENSNITRHVLREADILLTRSATRVHADLLQGSSVRFAATATIGDDHYDKAWLQAQGIGWANAAGSSTHAVIEYMLTALLELHSRGRIHIEQTTIGIIGAGRIGAKLGRICAAMGMQVLLNDPPRARVEGAAGFCALDELLAQADIVSLHTPLLKAGEDCTVHLLAEEQLQRFQGCGVINAGRGACVDNAALCDWLDGSSERFAVLDCWENEPQPLQRLLAHAGMAIATPHIAGHSVDGKAANTLFAYRALCRFLDVQALWDMQACLPPALPVLEIHAAGGLWSGLHAATTARYPIGNDHRTMRSWAGLSHADMGAAFVAYRRSYPARRGWQYAPVRFLQGRKQLLEYAAAMGLSIKQHNAAGEVA